MYVRAGRPAFARPYVGVHRSTSLMGSSLLLQQCRDWKKLRFILSVRFDFHMNDRLLIVAHAFVSRGSMSFSVDETLLSRSISSEAILVFPQNVVNFWLYVVS